MKNLRRVVWTRGMFLTPQHFQTHDNLIDDTLQFRFTASNFANWGVVELRIDQEGLANGLFMLRSCRGVLPDGTIFGIPESDAPPAGRAIAEHFGPTQDSLDVYLALPERQVVGKNFTQAAELQTGGAATRYVADTVEVLDENGYNESKAVQVANKNFRLMFGNQNLDGFHSLKIARVVRNDAGVYALDADFIPSCLNIAASDRLMTILRGEIEKLVSKAENLNAGRRQRSESLADFPASEAAKFWMLHTLNSCLPEFEHIWGVRRGHPEMLWVAMLRLAGALTTFFLDPKTREFPQYNHDNLGPCFMALDEKIRKLVDTVFPDKWVSIPLHQEGSSVWMGTISNDDYFKNTSFYLALTAKIGIDELITKVPLRVLVAATDELQNLVKHALPGIGLRHAPTPPAAIPFRMNNQYFTLNQTGRFWDRVRQSRTISLHIPPEIAEARPELIVLLP